MALSVQLRSVSKSYGHFIALKDLSLDVEEGKFITLLGPSGCGKTTTLRLISGFETPDAGEVYINGALVNAVPPFDRDVNTVFQSYALFPHLNVFENVAYGPSLRKLPSSTIRDQVADMLERVGLPDKARSMPSELSGGQRQRVALARALINEPKVLLLDEPLGALDAKLRQAMQLELKEIQASLGITFIYVTHDQDEALTMSDGIVVMNAGHIQQIGAPDEVYDRPRNRFVAEFMGTTNLIPGVVKAGDGSECVIEVNGHIWHAIRPGGLEVGSGVTLAVRPQHIRLLDDRAPPRERANCIRARIKDRVYAGVLVRLFLETDDGINLIVENTPEKLAPYFGDFRPGQKLTLEIPSQAVMVYADHPEASARGKSGMKVGAPNHHRAPI